MNSQVPCKFCFSATKQKYHLVWTADKNIPLSPVQQTGSEEPSFPCSFPECEMTMEDFCCHAPGRFQRESLRVPLGKKMHNFQARRVWEQGTHAQGWKTRSKWNAKCGEDGGDSLRKTCENRENTSALWLCDSCFPSPCDCSRLEVVQEEFWTPGAGKSLQVFAAQRERSRSLNIVQNCQECKRNDFCFVSGVLAGVQLQIRDGVQEMNKILGYWCLVWENTWHHDNGNREWGQTV